MGRLEDEYATVLEGVDAVGAALAKDLLARAGIPCLLHGPDFDVAELGRATEGMVPGTTVLVPKSALERASALLREAWGPGATEAEGA